MRIFVEGVGIIAKKKKKKIVFYSNFIYLAEGHKFISVLILLHATLIK